jgi:hypothetical protein
MGAYGRIRTNIGSSVGAKWNDEKRYIDKKCSVSKTGKVNLGRMQLTLDQRKGGA